MLTHINREAVSDLQLVSAERGGIAEDIENEFSDVEFANERVLGGIVIEDGRPASGDPVLSLQCGEQKRGIESLRPLQRKLSVLC